MRLLLIALSWWTIGVIALVIAGSFLAIGDDEAFVTTPISTTEAVVATLFTIPTLLLGFLVMVGLRPVEEG